MARYTQQVQAFQESPYLEMRGLKGLDLKVDFALRDPQSWVLLENFDLYLNGSIRKVKPPILYGNLQPNPQEVIYNFIEYRQFDSSPFQVVGVSNLGRLYDLTSGVQLAALPFGLTGIPYLCVMSGTRIPYNPTFWQNTNPYALNDFITKYGPDGNLYIFSVTTGGVSGANEPAWPVSGSITDGTVTWTNQGLQMAGQWQQNYLVIFPPQQRPWKWDGLRLTTIGVSLPGVPIGILSRTIATGPTISPAPHQVLNTGWQYAYTWFNPQTLAESSPSPLTGEFVNIVEADAGFANGQARGSFLAAVITPDGSPTQVSSVRLLVQVDQLAPPYGSNYTHLRFYRSRDGGSTLFLLTTVYDINSIKLTDANASVMPNQLTTPLILNAYRPLPVTESKTSAVVVQDGYDGVPNIVNDPLFLGPEFWYAAIGSGTPVGKQVITQGAGQSDPLNTTSDLQTNGITYLGSSGPTGGILYYFSFLNIKTAGPYTLHAYIDATSLSTGTVEWAIDTPNFTVLLALPQTPGAAGWVTGTVTLAVGTYMLCAVISGNVMTGGQVIWSNPIVQAGGVFNTNAGMAPMADAALITPSPGLTSNGPPPVSAWGAVYQGSLYALDSAKRTRLWFSNDYWEYFDEEGFMDLPTELDDQILSLEGGYDRLILGKEASIHEVSGVDPTTFRRVPLDPQHGVEGRRLTKAAGSTLFAWINQGLATFGLSTRPGIAAGVNADSVLLGFTPGSLIGEPIQPVTDMLSEVPDPALACITIDNKQNIVLVAANIKGGNIVDTGYNNVIILGQLTQQPGWAIYSGLPALGCITIREVFLPAWPFRAVLMSGGDGKMYQLFADVNPAQFTLVSQAITQPLPLPGQVSAEIWPTKKTFNELVVEGRNLEHFDVRYSADGGRVWTQPKVLGTRNKINLSGRALQIWFINNSTYVCGILDIISFMGLEYRIDGNTQYEEDDNVQQIVVPVAGPPLS